MEEQLLIDLLEDLVGDQIWRTDHVTNREPNRENLTHSFLTYEKSVGRSMSHRCKVFSESGCYIRVLL